MKKIINILLILVTLPIYGQHFTLPEIIVRNTVWLWVLEKSDLNKYIVGGYCSASYIAENVLVTAAHCIEGSPDISLTDFVIGEFKEEKLEELAQILSNGSSLPELSKDEMNFRKVKGKVYGDKSYFLKGKTKALVPFDDPSISPITVAYVNYLFSKHTGRAQKDLVFILLEDKKPDHYIVVEPIYHLPEAFNVKQLFSFGFTTRVIVSYKEKREDTYQFQSVYPYDETEDIIPEHFNPLENTSAKQSPYLNLLLKPILGSHENGDSGGPVYYKKHDDTYAIIGMVAKLGDATHCERIRISVEEKVDLEKIRELILNGRTDDPSINIIFQAISSDPLFIAINNEDSSNNEEEDQYQNSEIQCPNFGFEGFLGLEYVMGKIYAAKEYSLKISVYPHQVQTVYIVPLYHFPPFKASSEEK
jgi:hypothetical protein